MTTTRSRRRQQAQQPTRQQPPRGCFKAPSSSSPSTLSPAPSISKAKSVKPAPAPEPAAAKLKKTASRVYATRRAAANEAQKKDKAKDKANPDRRKFPSTTWVHIGNLDPELSKDALVAHFSAVGAVLYADIRYCGSMVRGRPDLGYRYAIVKFATRFAARNALNLGNTKVEGSLYPLVVEPDLTQLPEVLNMTINPGDRVPDPAEPAPVVEGFQTASGLHVPAPGRRAKKLGSEKTQVWKPDAEVVRTRRRAKGKHLVVGGTSFTMTLA
ncbi:hypothetical protein C8R44DRAFT_928891 [Mycena epipterygia]|nr:hypothetical protein C8R44DRAFT_928891 [Mycena epipterygia]